MAWFNQVVGPRRSGRCAVVRTNQNQNFAKVGKGAKLAGIKCASLTDIVVEEAFVLIQNMLFSNVSHNVPGSFNN